MALSSKNICVLLAACLLGSTNAVYRHEFTGSLASDCRFVLGDREYDLCPIVRGPVTYLVYDHSNALSNGLTYKFNLGGSIRDSEDQACNQDTWICMINQPRGSAVTKIPLTGNFDQKNDEPYAMVELDKVDHAPLTMTFNRQPRQPTSRIYFLCDSNVKTSEPFFVRESDGIYLFTWTTDHACGQHLGLAQYAIAPESNASDNSDDEDKDHEDQGLLDPLPISNRPQRSIATIVLLAGSAIIILAYIVHSPPAYLRRFIQTGLTPSRRIREGRLIHWAEEEIAMLEGEEDLMVNANDLEWGGMEEIPLKPSPKRNGFLAKYGSI